MPNEKYALITGASSGIGYELTKIFAKNGYNIVIVARSQERLDEIARDWTSKYGVKVMPMAKDLFDPAAPQEIYDEIKRWGIEINALVNDAGQGVYGFFHKTDLQRELDIIQLNIVSMVTLTKLFLKDMVERKEGKILNLASMVSKMPSPLMAVYSATKAFIYNFTESLVNELQDTGVTITALLPGATATDFFHKANAENTVTYQDYDLSDPEDVANDGYNAMMNGDRRVISGLKNKFSAMMSNMVPDSVIVDSMRKQMDEKKPDKPNEQDMQGNYQATVLPVPDSENNTASRNTENYKQAADNNNYSQERDSSLPANQANLPIETTQPGTQLPMEQQKNANREPGNNDIPNDPATDNR